MDTSHLGSVIVYDFDILIKDYIGVLIFQTALLLNSSSI